jgi:hypothetical protein
VTGPDLFGPAAFLRLRSETDLYSRRRIIVYSVGLRNRYRSEQVVRNDPTDFRSCPTPTSTSRKDVNS